jgi:hypothetical protein
VQGLGRYGLEASKIPVLVEASKRASSMKGNPIELTDDELGEIAVRALWSD